MKGNGIYFGIDWYSTSCTDYKKFNKKFKSFSQGTFSYIGNVYFSSLADIKFFFKKFKILKLEKKIYICSKTNNHLASWIIVAKKQ